MNYPEDLHYSTKSIVIEELLEIVDLHYERLTWNILDMSLFIESILIRFPVPLIILDITTSPYKILDGKNRIHTLVAFIKNEFKLRELSILHKLNGLTFDELLPIYQRRLLERPLPVYLIESGTTDEMKQEILRRIW